MRVATVFTIQLSAEAGPHRYNTIYRTTAITGQHILLAKDNAANTLLLKKILENAGYAVITVENGGEVLNALDRERFDMIIMDIHMPRMDSVEVTRRIRQRSGPVSGLPIVALIGNGLAADQHCYLSTG